MQMTTKQSTLLLFLTIVCAVSVVRQYQVLDTYWNRTEQEVKAAYETAQHACQLEQRDFCGSPQDAREWEAAWSLTVSLEHDSVSPTNAIDSIDKDIITTETRDQPHKDDAKQKIPEPLVSPKLTASSSSSKTQLRTSRRLHATHYYDYYDTTFPSPCLNTAWIEQQARPVCSRALHHLHNIRTLQQHQWSTAQTFKAVFGVFWIVLIAVWGVMYWIFRSSDLEEIQEYLLMKHHSSLKSDDSCCCCCCSCSCCDKKRQKPCCTQDASSDCDCCCCCCNKVTK